jgi:hypothetical protein
VGLLLSDSKRPFAVHVAELPLNLTLILLNAHCRPPSRGFGFSFPRSGQKSFAGKEAMSVWKMRHAFQIIVIRKRFDDRRCDGAFVQMDGTSLVMPPSFARRESSFRRARHIGHEIVHEYLSHLNMTIIYPMQIYVFGL